MKRRTATILGWGIFTLLLAGMSLYTYLHADGQFGETMLYGITGLVAATFLFSCFPPVGPRMQKIGFIVRRVVFGVIVLFVGGFCFLLIACRTDEVTYQERYAVVLGAPLRADKVSSILMKRVETAADFLKKDKEAVAVLTGGNSPYVNEDREVSQVTTEGAYMAMQLMASGIQPERLYLESDATTTLDNFYYSVDLLRDAGYQDGDPVVIITNRFHSFRVRRLAKEAGLTNFLILSAPVPFHSAITWYLREIPLSILFLINRSLVP